MPKFFKLVVFVPVKYLEKVRLAVCAAGAGRIGRHYDYCTFYAIGTGTFRPLEGARPYLGKLGRLEKVREARLETIVPLAKLKKVVAAIKQAHPYEEPAYDLIPLIMP